MKQFNKKIFALFIPIFILSILTVPVSASEDCMVQSIHESVDSLPLLDNIGTVSIKNSIRIDGVEKPLYSTFDEPSQAIENIVEETPSVLSLLSETYGLAELSDSNYLDYQNAMNKYLDDPDHATWYSESSLEFRKLRAFLDVYENQDSNEEILEYISESSSVPSSIRDEALEKMLPYSSSDKEVDSAFSVQPFSLQVSSVRASTIKLLSTSSYSVDDAVTYANTYAESINLRYRYFFGGDCTNFVSQILDAGGIEQDVTTSTSSGWWYTLTKTSKGYLHTNSLSWTCSDNCATYFGIDYATYTNGVFAALIQEGDVIFADWTCDGDWDHAGFVVDKASSKGSLGYYDYKVAQHTTNYNAWASSSTNNWDLIADDGGKYGIFRP